jgi:hypothetical protein
MLEMEALRKRLARWRERAERAEDGRQRAKSENIAGEYEALMETAERSCPTLRPPAYASAD